MPNTILLEGAPHQFEENAGAALTPGHILDYDGSGDVIVHGEAGGNWAGLVAAENYSDPSEEISDAYESGDRVHVLAVRRGDMFYGFLADGENVSKGDMLESDGAGGLQAFQGATDTGEHANIVGIAAEALNNSSGSQARIRVRAA